MNKRPACPICGEKRTAFSDKFWVCSKCSYQFSNPQDKIFTKSYYQQDIGLLVQNVLEGETSDVQLRKYAQLALSEITSLGQKVAVCDIGCGTGVFLKDLKKKKYKVYGYDINKAQTEFARKSNKLANVIYAQSLKQYCRKMKIKKNYFDVITCFEVIEHVLDVNSFVDEVYTYLKPGGVFIFSTPNNERMQIHEKWDYPPIHVSRFKKENIEILLKNHKFLLRSFKTFNELGYYSGNLIAKLKLSHKALEKMVEVSSDQGSRAKADRNAQLFKFLAQSKKTACMVLDFPLYLYLLSKPSKGHTMFVTSKKPL